MLYFHQCNWISIRIVPANIVDVCSLPIGRVSFPYVVVDIVAARNSVQDILVHFRFVWVTSSWGNLRFLLLGGSYQFFFQKPVPTKSQRIGFILLLSRPYKTSKIAEIPESSFIIIWTTYHPTHPQGHHNRRLTLDNSPKMRKSLHKIPAVLDFALTV